MRIAILLIALAAHQSTCLPSWAEEILQTLSLDEKIGQLFMVPARADSALHTQDSAVSTHHVVQSWQHMQQDYVDYLITNYHVGGVIYMGKHTSAEQLLLTQRFQTSAQIPLLIAQDFEWGLNMRLTDCPPFPRAMTVSAAHDVHLTYLMGHEIGTQCRAVGVHINFAPVVDVNTNPQNPIIGTRSFGDTPERVIAHASAYAQGLLDAGILSCIKHFPGHGDTSADSHYTLPVVAHSQERLEKVELAPFKALIKNGIPGVMVAHLNVPALDASGTPSSLSKVIVTDLLRNTYAFDGLIITDGLDMKALHLSPADLALQALLAGNDILLSLSDVPSACALIKQAVAQGDISLADLDAHVLRILKAKEWIFISNHHPRIPATVLAKTVWQPTATHIQQTLYQKACTPLSNHESISPLDTLSTFYITSIGTCKAPFFIQHMQNNCPQAIYSSIDQVLQSCKNQTIVIALCSDNGYYSSKLPDNALKQIKLLTALGNLCIVVLFGSPYLIPTIPKVDTLLIAYESNEPAQHAAARILLGKIEPQGQLPIQI